MSISRRTLGHSGIEVSTIGLGTMMFGGWGNTDLDECRRMLDLALDAGVTLVDTADVYRGSEEFLGDALRGRRDRVVLATKVGLPMSDDPAERGLSRRWITRQCEASLRKLGTDHVDLLQMHRPDPATPIDETLAAFDELVKAGKVRAIGTSMFSSAQIEEIHAHADERGMVRSSTEQPRYNLLTRGLERSVVPTSRRLGVSFLVFSPLDGGWLTGKYQSDAPGADSRAARHGSLFDHSDAAIRDAKRHAVDRLAKVADGAGLSLMELALGFVLRESTVASALIGPRTLPQLEELLAISQAELSPDVVGAIDAIVPPGTNVNPAQGAHG